MNPTNDSPRPDRNDDAGERLRAELLELFYDCHEDPEPLLERIATEPEVAALFEEVRAEAEILGEAARDDVRPLALEVPGGRRRTWRGRLAIAAAAVLVLVPLAPWLASHWSGWRARALERSTLRLVVSGPASTADAAPTSFRVETWSGTGDARTATVAWRVRGQDGATLHRSEAIVDGALDLRVPPVVAPGATLEVTARADGDERTTTLPLGAQVRSPLAHLTVDKPVYRPGETARLRAVLLDRLTLAPIDERVRLRVVDALGNPVTTIVERSEDGVVASALEIADDAAGGEWAFELRDANDRFTVERLPFQVRLFQAPKLKTTLVLDRETYAPGETGSAALAVERLAGGAAAGATATAMLVVDGETVESHDLVLDSAGETTVSFTVPETVERGEARLVARIADRGVVETTLEPFVVPTGRVDVAFFPEGGDLVAGLENRVYAEVTDPLGRPLAAEGRVVDDAGREVAAFDTQHQGRARFSFTPVRGRTYRLEIESPAAPPVPLPTPVADGVTLAAVADSYEAGAGLALTASTPTEGPWMVAAFCRGVLVAQDAFAGAGRHSVSLGVPPEVAGVLRVTLFDAALEPRAERLVHRASGNDLRVAVTPLDPRVAPGDAQKVEVRTTDGAGSPVSAIVGLTVTDRAVRDLVGEPRIGLADQAWLVGDVRELEDAGEFLGGGPDAARNVDLLLGTRGWRRFAWVDPASFLERHGDEAKALLALEAAGTPPRVVDTRREGKAEISALKASERRLGRTARGLFVLALLVAGTLLLAAGAAWLARRIAPTVRFAAPVAAALAVALVAGLLTRTASRFAAGPLEEKGEFFLAAGFAEDAMAPVAAAAPAPGAVFLDDQPEAEEEQWLGLEELGYVGAPGGGGGGPRFAALNKGLLDAEEVALEDADAVGRVAGDDGDDFRFADDKAFEARRWKKARLQRVRVYAHRNPRSGARTDFTETVYWNPALRTDEDGRATVEFDVSDAVTTWSAFADAHGASRIGQGAAAFDAALPFRMLAKLPNEVTQGDRLELPIALVSDDPEIERATVAVEALGPLTLAGDVPGEVGLADGGARVLVPLEVGAASDADARLVFRGDGVRWGDRVERTLRVVPRGFPQRVSKSGVVTDRVAFRVDLPAEVTPGSLRTSLTLYPSPLADLMRGMDGMLREPHGCFEQASSSNYPNVLALAYLEAAGGDDPAFERRARELLGRGYAKITGYECSERGYEWFGGDPAHEALSAYGLLEFHDMTRVHDVDRAMVDRTRAWVLSRRDGRGGYERNARALDSFGAAPPEVTDAYVTYALAATGDDPAAIATELDRLAVRAVESDDPYEVALAAGALHEAGRANAADAARDRLKSMQRADGSLVGATTSITSSRGVNLAIETTGWAALAWLQDDDDRAHVERAVEFLLSNRSGGGTFGATQATIVALRTLTAYAEETRRVAHAGVARVVVNDHEVEALSFPAGHRGALTIAPFADALREGENEVVIELTGDNEFPWSFDLAYHSEQPADHPDAAVAVETSLARDEVEEGETVPLTVRVENRTDDGLPMTMAIAGLPAGLEADPKVLDDLKEAGRFDLWEQAGRDVVLYWRGLAPRASKEVTLDLVARIPGTTTGPASRAYLYYTSDQKRWAPPLTVRVVANGAAADVETPPSPLALELLEELRRLVEAKVAAPDLELGAALTWAKERATPELFARLAARLGASPEDVAKRWLARERGAPLGRWSYGAGTFVLGFQKATDGFEGRDADDSTSRPPWPARDLQERIAERLREKALERARSAKTEASTDLADVPPTDVEWWDGASLRDRTSFLLAFFVELSGTFEPLPPDRRDCATCAGRGHVDFFGASDPEKLRAVMPCPRCKTLGFDRIAVAR
ncbi:MAG: MG2 domain-containing protein [Planctomycetota bacterium JB042]